MRGAQILHKEIKSVRFQLEVYVLVVLKKSEILCENKIVIRIREGTPHMA